MKSHIKIVGLLLFVSAVVVSVYFLFEADTDACVDSTNLECEELSKSVGDLAPNTLMELSDSPTVNQIESPSIITLENAVIPNSKNNRPRLIAPQEKGEIATTEIRQ